MRDPLLVNRRYLGISGNPKCIGPIARRLLVPDRDALTRVNAPGVEVQPAYEWLLATPTQG